MMSILGVSSVFYWFSIEIKKSGFLYYKDGKGKFIEGYDIENPQDKIIMVFNRGSWHVKKGSRFCIQKKGAVPSLILFFSNIFYYHWLKLIGLYFFINFRPLNTSHKISLVKTSTAAINNCEEFRHLL